MAKRLADICHREDPTRPVTSACNNPGAAERTGFAKALDVFGINYSIGDYQRFKGRTLVASETASALSTRGEYNLVPGKDGKLHIEIERGNQSDLLRPGRRPVGDTRRSGTCWPWRRRLGSPASSSGPASTTSASRRPSPGRRAARTSASSIVRLPQGPLLSLSQPLAARAAGAPPAALDLAGLGRQGDPGLGGDELRHGRTVPQRQVAGRKEARREEIAARRVERAVRARNAHGGGQEGRPGRRRTTRFAPWASRQRLVLAADRPRIAADGDDLAFVTVRVVDCDGLVCPDAGATRPLSSGRPGADCRPRQRRPDRPRTFLKAGSTRFSTGWGLWWCRRRGAAGRMTLRAEADGLAPAEISVDSFASP